MKFRKPLRLAAVLFLIASVLVIAVACGGDDDNASTGATGATAATGSTSSGATGASATIAECAANGASALTGAGATFPFPLYSQWIDTYGKDCKVEINYQSIGSGGGIKNITEQTVDFGASDGIMNDDQIAAAKAAGGDILHIAMTSGSEAVVFNLPGIKSGGLKLDGATLANIYLGKVKKWNDPAITALNAGVDLPNTDIAVVHRSDGSGTSFIFTNYLSKVSDEWKNGPGYATSVEWPTGVGAQGNEGVAGQVSQLPGAIGYVELAYAIQNNIPWVQLKNKAGKFLEPSIDGTTAAAAGITIPADMKILITDQSGADAYPIAGFTWVLAYVNQTDAAKGETLAHYLWWAIHDGQAYAKDLDYGPLSSDAVKAAEAQIMKLDCGGVSCLTGDAITSSSSNGSSGATGATGASATMAECAANGASALTGAGATFPFPLYSQWIDTYGKDCKVEINYQSIGSGGGIKNITEQTVDFGASDGIMNDDQIAAAKAAGGDILHIAMTSGSEAVVFNLPGIKSGGLKLDGATLANIYLGKVKKWNDPAITALNAGVDLPNTDIAVVHRSDGSGTSFIFTNYLSKVSDEWKNGPGYATSVEWPTGVGAQGNEGVAGQVSQLPGAIGYVELAYAIQNNIPWVQLKNKAGKFLEPSIDGTTAAAAGITIPADMKILITDQSGADAYPIAGFTWVLAYVNQTDAAKGETLAHYLWWAIHDGQAYAKDLDYGPLSSDAVKAAEAQIMKLMCGSSPCLSQ